jgi:hypothetical protein
MKAATTGCNHVRRNMQRNKQDSKISREFLRRVMKCLGREVPGDITLNSWELFDFIEKDISIILKDLKRAKGNIKNLMSADEDRRQFTIAAIGDFYDVGNGKRWKGNGKEYKMERKDENQMDEPVENK